MPFRTAKRWPAFIRSKAGIIALALLVVGLAVAVGQEVVRRVALHGEQEKLMKEISELENRQRDLTSLIDRLNSDSYREQQARLQLNLQRPGETTVIVPEGQGASSTVPAVYPATPTKPVANPVKWWRYFFS